jgi:hypothetical protein
MAGGRVKFGLTLPNRGVVIGVTTVAEMLQLAADAESSGWDSVWVGDSIFAKPRLDAMVLMGAIAARTNRVRIGPACFASTPLRNALVLAYQWASLDFLSGGRTVFVACQGQPYRSGGAFDKEFAHFGIEPSRDAASGHKSRESLDSMATRQQVRPSPESLQPAVMRAYGWRFGEANGTGRVRELIPDPAEQQAIAEIISMRARSFPISHQLLANTITRHAEAEGAA